MVADAKKNVLGIGDQMTISQETLQVLEKSLPAAGITFTLMSDSWGLGETDVTPIANKIAAKAKEVNPDAIILASNPVHVNPLIAKLKGLGVTAPVYNQASGAHPLPLFAPAGNDPANVAGNFTFGPAIVDPTKIPDDYPAKKDLIAFVERWRADNPKEPFASLFLGFAYDTIHLAEAAITTAATQDRGRLGCGHGEGRLVGCPGSLRHHRHRPCGQPRRLLPVAVHGGRGLQVRA